MMQMLALSTWDVLKAAQGGSLYIYRLLGTVTFSPKIGAWYSKDKQGPSLVGVLDKQPNRLETQREIIMPSMWNLISGQQGEYELG